MNKTSQSLAVKSLPWMFLLFWIFLNPWLWHFGRFFYQVNSIGSLFGAASFIFFSFSFLFNTRWKKLEDWIGGLDQVFRFHQFLGKSGYFCLVIHVLVFSLRWAQRGFSSYLLYLLPIHQRLSINLGSYAFILITLILTITIFKLFPYHIWKKIHQWMSAAFLISFLHFFLSNRTFGSPLSNQLLYLATIIGFGSIVYRQFLFGFLVKPFQYNVIKTEAINENLLKVTLHAKNKEIYCFPGQYAFIHFEEPNFSKEQHPFTLAKNEHEDHFLIFVKVRGDYTKALQQQIKPNWTAFLEGPYGRLNYQEYQKQIWIAGGIGIALFLSWVHSFKPHQNKTIDLFFCCHNQSDLAILKEFTPLQTENLGIKIYTFCSEKNQRLCADEIIKICPDYKDRRIFMCGPKKLTSDMKKQLIALSTEKRNIEYEDFDFF